MSRTMAAQQNIVGQGGVVNDSQTAGAAANAGWVADYNAQDPGFFSNLTSGGFGDAPTNPFSGGYDADWSNLGAGLLTYGGLVAGLGGAPVIAPFAAAGARYLQGQGDASHPGDPSLGSSATGGTPNPTQNGTVDPRTGAPVTPGSPGAPGSSGGGSPSIYQPTGGYGGGDPTSLNGIAQQAFAFGGQNRDWLMGQNATAQNYYHPATQAYQGMYGPGGTLSGPGAGEQAFQQTGRSVLNQTPIQQYQQQTAGQLGQQGAGENAYGYMMNNGLGSPGVFEQGAGAYRGALAAPGASQQYAGQVGGQLQQPGQLERNSGGYDRVLGGPSNAQQAYGAMGGAYQAPTALESAYGGLMSGYGQQGMAQRAAPGLAQSLSGGQSQDVYAKQSGQLDKPGQLEQFAASDANGTNPYFDQLRKSTNASLDQEFNAGGNFNSGARMAALAKADSNLSAQQYQQEAQLQGQAQQATQSRLGQQQGLAGQASGEQLGRTQAQAGLLGGADQQQLQRLGGQAGLAGDVSGQSLNYLNSGINAAQGVDTGNLSRINSAAGIDQNAQAGQLARTALGGQLAGQSDQSSLARLQAGAGLLNQQQQDQQSRLGMVGQYGNNAQSQQLARMGLGGQLAGQSTAAGFQQYNDYLNQAMAAQGAGQQRQQQGFSDAFQQGNAQAGLQQGFATNASDAYAQMIQAGLGANVNALGLSMQQQQTNADRQLAYLGLGIKGASSLPSLIPGYGGGTPSLPPINVNSGGGGGGYSYPATNYGSGDFTDSLISDPTYDPWTAGGYGT